VERYQRQAIRSRLSLWHFGHMCRSMPAGRDLRVEANEPASLVWTLDDWQHTHDSVMTPSGVGTYFVDLPTADLPSGRSATFTFRWERTNRWQGRNYEVSVEPDAG
jgi:glucoamylase